MTGGYDNTASGNASSVTGGSGNSVDGDHDTIVGGDDVTEVHGIGAIVIGEGYWHPSD